MLDGAGGGQPHGDEGGKRSTTETRNARLEANAAKYLAGGGGVPCLRDRGHDPRRHGLFKEFQVERYLREVLIPRIAPITPHMILNFVAEKALGLPKSY